MLFCWIEHALQTPRKLGVIPALSRNLPYHSQYHLFIHPRCKRGRVEDVYLNYLLSNDPNPDS